MPHLPTGTVTFLFTDIEGSTRLLEQLRERYAEVLVEHRRLLRNAFAQAGGQEIDTQGDAFFVAFARARDALLAAVSAQRALHSHRWPGGTAVQVRMGMHTGEPLTTDPEYVGIDVHRAARISQAGHGGQILLSQTTRDLIDDEVPEGITMRDLGMHRLKDLSHPQRIFQVVADDLPSDFPPLQSLDVSPNNLPGQLSSFIGREQEMAAVKRLLSSARQVTLTGAGGSGKTRLALQVGADLLEDFADGVWWVEFSALSDPSLVAQTVAASLGLRDFSERPILAILTDFLQFKHLLLVLDNCEHVVAECAHLADHLLRACQGIRILATSQTVLGVPGEATYGVPPLSLPDPLRASPDHLTQYEAVRLFVERAVLSKPGFTLTPDNAVAVAQVVQQLDGIPLAIELAAARAKMMSIQQISERLDDRFRLLTAGGRTVAPRHKTLKAAMDWSYELLTESERTLLRWLSVFAGGWTLEAAEAICTGGDVEEGQILDLLARLVDRSLALAEESPGGSTRYRLLETVRQYGLDRLRESGEEERIRTRHRDRFLLLAERADQHLQGAGQRTWLDLLEIEHDNLRLALEWCKTGRDDPEYWLRLAGALWRFWEVRGYWSEGRMWLDAAIAQTEGLATLGRVKVLNAAAYLASFQGDFARAVALGNESLDLSQRLGDKRGRVFCLTMLGMEACRLERYDRAAELGQESLALSQEVGDWWGTVEAQIVLAIVARARGDYERASTLMEEIVLKARQAGDTWRLSVALNNLGLVKRELGDYARAKEVLEETLALTQELGDKWGVAFAQSNLGIVAWYQKDYPQAADQFAKSLRLRVEVGEKRGIVTSLLGLAAVAAAQGHAERAAMLFSAAEALREAIGVPLPPFIRGTFEQRVGDTRTALGEGRFEEMWAKARTLPLDAAIAYALEEVSKKEIPRA